MQTQLAPHHHRWTIPSHKLSCQTLPIRCADVPLGPQPPSLLLFPFLFHRADGRQEMNGNKEPFSAVVCPKGMTMAKEGFLCVLWREFPPEHFSAFLARRNYKPIWRGSLCLSTTSSPPWLWRPDRAVFCWQPESTLATFSRFSLLPRLIWLRHREREFSFTQFGV